jgi:hypothetical protein
MWRLIRLFAILALTLNVAAGGPAEVRAQASVRIRDIQGVGHRSPLDGQLVTAVPGIVTAVRNNGFFMQDATDDGNPATSEGIWVFTRSAPTVSAGDAVTVHGTVRESRPGCDPTCAEGSAASQNLTTTQINPSAVNLVSSGNPLPPPVLVGTAGRTPPSTAIDDDSIFPHDIEVDSTFRPDRDGIDFFESLEGMRVRIDNAVVVGPRNNFGEIPVVTDGAGVRTARGGILARLGDANPERVTLDDGLMQTPNVNVGDRFPGALVGIMDYSFANYKLQVTELPPVVAGGLSREITAGASDPNELTIGSFNVENLSGVDDQSKFDELAELIVSNLKSPDILAIQEIQDNDGAANSGTVNASTTWERLIAAISVAGGPSYQHRQIDPIDGADGGQPGGNIRVGLLFRTDRGVAFVDRPGGGPATATTIATVAGRPALSASPGRVDPANAAFTSSRKPLAAEFTHNCHTPNCHTLFVVANHFNSKGEDQRAYGRHQPPMRLSDVQRVQQAAIVNDFVDGILAVDPAAKIVVLGDINDHEYSIPLYVLKGSPPVLHDLVETLPEAERYTYVFEGNSQALDHILVSSSLLPAVVEYDVVHVNAEFHDQASDHDPEVVRLRLPRETG